MGSARRRRGPVRAPGKLGCLLCDCRASVPPEARSRLPLLRYCASGATAASALLARPTSVRPAAGSQWGRTPCRGRAVRERRPPPPAPAPSPPPPPPPPRGSQRAWRAACRPDAARELPAGGPRRRSALFPRSPPLPGGRRPTAERPHGAPHLRARRRLLLHLLNYKDSERRLCPPLGGVAPRRPRRAAGPRSSRCHGLAPRGGSRPTATSPPLGAPGKFLIYFQL